ncbi:MAG: DUF1343 domain-containing protein [Oligoflexales bacterium]|nr:DUF1343 domain-containing protein [Oligoflexales bacterium]
MSQSFLNGLEVLIANPAIAKSWGRCGLLCNQASTTKDFLHSSDAILKVLNKQLVCFFGPQHGIFGTVQDNMIETEHQIDPSSGLPIYSLYSETREPTEKMMREIDTLIFDVQIVGCRVYTFKWTLAACLRAAKKYKKNVVVLDRPNPLGGELLEGAVLNMKLKSFVGEAPIPMRHGLTVGEFASYINDTIGADLKIVEMQGWNPRLYYGDLQRPWVMTSPNLPTLDAVYVYPGMVIFEGTNLSEGRGTTLPFQLIGAPYLKNGSHYKEHILSKFNAEGVYLRPVEFMPTFHKWKGEVCHGIQLHIIDQTKICSYKLALAMVRAAIDIGGDAFTWKQPPYEYDLVNLPIKLIFGIENVDQIIKANTFDVSDACWIKGIKEYKDSVLKNIRYERDMRYEI